MIKIDRAVIVEGRYDKIKLNSVIDAVIIETDGFGIFNDREKQLFIRRLAASKGLLILTDSDSAGFKIRSFLKSIVPAEQIKHAYIPDIFGKEKRKAAPSKEGKLGVEGVRPEIITEALERAGVLCEQTDSFPRREITKLDFFEDGLTGGENSSELRAAFLKKTDLPERMTTNALLQAVNIFMTYDEYKNCISELKSNDK